MHPWHDVEIEVEHANAHIVNAVIEIPKGSKIKYELDKKAALLMSIECFLVVSIIRLTMDLFLELTAMTKIHLMFLF